MMQSLYLPFELHWLASQSSKSGGKPALGTGNTPRDRADRKRESWPLMLNEDQVSAPSQSPDMRDARWLRIPARRIEAAY